MDIEEVAQKIRNRISWNTNVTDEMTLFQIKQIVEEVLQEEVDNDSPKIYDPDEYQD
jgi:hypothetical protein